MKSFYDWCVENDRMDLINLWSESNKYLPNEISCWSTEKIIFEYEGNSHPYKLDRITYQNPLYLRLINYKSKLYFEKHPIKIKKVKEPTIKNTIVSKNDKSYYYKAGHNRPDFKESLYDWCILNNRIDILDRWDYGLNEKSPKDYSSKSHCEIYLKCPKEIHDSELFMIMSITNMNIEVKCRQCNSFGQWLIDIYGSNAINDFWDYDKNVVNPFNITIGNQKTKVYLKNYEGITSVQRYPSSFIKSYERKSKNAGISKRNKQKRISSRHYLIDTYPHVEELWSDKNTLSFSSMYITYNDEEIYWKCENGIHEDYIRNVRDSKLSHFKCPHCLQIESISSLQESTLEYLKANYSYAILHEYDCTILPVNPLTGRKLPFDNEIIELKLIIEVHGQQHYDITGFTHLLAKYHNSTIQEELEYQKWKDEYKKEYALNKGYSYLELPYWTFNDNTYKTLIDNKIIELLEEPKQGSFLF